jgi:uridine phosphorylase
MAYPILEFDPGETAIIEPRAVAGRKPAASRAVLCFFNDILKKLAAENILTPVFFLRTEMGKHPVYEMTWQGQRLALAHPGMGAPMAAAFMEEMIANGVNKIIACGGAGVLRSDIPPGRLVVPDSAVRDEGTSYHYLAPAREAPADARALAVIRSVLEKQGCAYISGKTWTTDAIYRETAGRMAKRRQEGCVTVEMECAALCAVAAFRQIVFGQILYAGDNLDGETWESRHWETLKDVRERLFYLAVEACVRL